MVFATTAFQQLTQQIADHTAPKGARIIVVPHPLGGTDAEVVRGWGARACDDVLAALLAGD